MKGDVMRSLRLPLAGAVILVLLGTPGGFVVAVDEGAPASDRPHLVSGTLQYIGMFEPKTTTVEAGRFLDRGYGYTHRVELDDPRLSGTMWDMWNKDSFVGPVGPDGEAMTGTVELVNDDGSWVGTLRGYGAYPHTGLHRYWQLELTGTGAYEGHSALLQANGIPTDVFEVEGFVFPGTLPPYPDPVEIPAE
jgi:hypothetical protein